MDDVRIGQALRAIRVRKRLRQSDVALLARVPREDVIAIEAGRLASIDWGRIHAIARALDASLRTEVRWQGADLDRLLAEGHAALHEQVGALFARLPGWEHLSEVSFSIHGERGVIDILAWHAPTRSLLIVELKTALGDPQALVGTMDRRIRLARRIAAERGWDARTVSALGRVRRHDDQPASRRASPRVAEGPVPARRSGPSSMARTADRAGDGAELLVRCRPGRPYGTFHHPATRAQAAHRA
jgi:transcriptional regulator with XRE-family HTH domain